MEYIRQTVSSAELNNLFNNLPPSLRGRRVEVIILPVDNSVAGEAPNHGCNIGCCPDLPELPDSFFEPLPEEDLQAWGL